MAQVTIDIPDDQVNRVLDAFATRFGWVSVQASGTKAAFAKAHLAKLVREIVKQEEIRQAQMAASSAVTDTSIS